MDERFLFGLNCRPSPLSGESLRGKSLRPGSGAQGHTAHNIVNALTYPCAERYNADLERGRLL